MIGWVKSNKFASLLLLILLFMLFRSSFGGSNPVPLRMYDSYGRTASRTIGMAPQAMGELNVGVGMPTTNTKQTVTSDRMVMQESSLSLLVKNVVSTKDAVLAETTRVGGFMVNTYINNPQDAATANITVRIPSKRLDEALNAFRGMAIRVTSENLQGTDVTDQYIDIEAQLKTLQSTKAKFESILEKATEIDDILRVQREIINLQSQIDSLKGQQMYLEKNVEMARITVYLSTDELSLPYAPDQLWRPELVFKQAVRSVVGTLRNIGSMLIWIGVYSVIWVPLLVIFLVVKRRMGKNKETVKV